MYLEVHTGTILVLYCSYIVSAHVPLLAHIPLLLVIDAFHDARCYTMNIDSAINTIKDIYMYLLCDNRMHDDADDADANDGHAAVVDMT